MSNAKAKTINVLLYDGDLNGVISIEDSGWNSGELYSAPRDSVSELINSDACKKYGVYLLLSDNMVYIGQSSDLSKRINQHIVGKNWWESVIVLTTSNDSLTHTDIDYLESVLIEKAMHLQHLDCDNKNKGNNPKVSKFRKVELDQFLDEALFLMKFIGISVFSNSKITKKNGALLNTVTTKTKLAIGKRAKNEAIQFLANNKIMVGKKATYAVKQPSSDEYWANPQTGLLNSDWDIILNDNVNMELIVLKVPAFTFVMDMGIKVRADKKNLMDMRINGNTLIEKKSGLDFSPYLVTKIKY